jgi:endonuclease/exonuclease/phosphatase (EEP) superfamily protein YafD
MTALLGLLRLGLALVALGLSGTAVAAWFGFAVPLFDLFNHFQVPLIAGMLVALIGVLVLFIGSSWQLLLSVVLLAGLAASALTVVPETVAELRPHAPLPGDGRPVIKLMTHNLFGLNYDMRRVARVIAAENPDIVALQEYFPEQRERLPQLLAATYPYSTHCVGGKRANIALFSKLPFEQAADGDCTTDPAAAGRTAHILATFTLPDGSRFAVLTTHFDWPYPIERQRRQRETIVKAIKAVTVPLLVVGDFNSTPWSYAQRDFAAEAGLDRQTHGLLTWPLMFSIKGWRSTPPILPLDQVMTRGPVAIHDLHTAAPTGSDHLPIVVTFSLGSAADG